MLLAKDTINIKEKIVSDDYALGIMNYLLYIILCFYFYLALSLYLYDCYN